MILFLMPRSSISDIDAATMRITGAFKTTTLDTDPHLMGMFSALEYKGRFIKQ